MRGSTGPTLPGMDLRIFTEPQQGASHADLLAVARATRDGGFSAFFRSDHVLAMGDGSRAARPVGVVRQPGCDRRAGPGHPARHPGHLGDLPAPVDDGHRRRPDRRHLRRPNGTRPRLRLVRGRAQGLRPGLRDLLRSALRPAHRAVGDHHRAVGDARRRDVRPFRGALHAGRGARPAQAGADRCERARRGCRSSSAATVRAEPLRWQHVSPTSSTWASPTSRSARRSSAASGRPARRSTGIPARWSTRSRTRSASGRTTPNSSAAPPRSAAPRRRRGTARSPAPSPR